MEPMAGMFRSLGTPDVTPDLKRTIVEGVLREAGQSFRGAACAGGERAPGGTPSSAGGAAEHGLALKAGERFDGTRTHRGRRHGVRARPAADGRAGRAHRAGANMSSTAYDPAFWSRFQFAFTLTYHYLFPQLTMGLAWFLVYWKWRALRTGDDTYNQAVRFWAKIFGLNFAVGVVTGIPMEFQFGTNWADFSRYAGGVIGQTLAMEGMFAFFLESAFVGALIWGEKRLGPRYHFVAALAVAVGSWLSGYFILVTNAFMQHPVGYDIDGRWLAGHRQSQRLPAESAGRGCSSPTIKWPRS